MRTLQLLIEYGSICAQVRHRRTQIGDQMIQHGFCRMSILFDQRPGICQSVIQKVRLDLRLQSDGSPWRPLVHIEDISRAFLAMLEAPRELVAADVVLNQTQRTVTRAGETLDLTRKEFDLLALLAADPGALRSRDEILEEVLRDVRDLVNGPVERGLAETSQPDRDLPFRARQYPGSVDPVIGVFMVDHRLLPQLTD